MSWRLVRFCFGVLILMGWIQVQSQPELIGDVADLRHRPDRILVLPKSGQSPETLLGFRSQHPLKVIATFPRFGGLLVVELRPGLEVGQVIADLQASGRVEFAEPDYIVTALTMPDDPALVDGRQWGLHNTGQNNGEADADIDAIEGWSTLNDATGTVVAVIDTGVRHTHEDLLDNMWVNASEIPGNERDDDGNGYVDDVHGINAITNTGDPRDDAGHGTHVAGILGAVGNNSRGVAGVAWRVRIMALKFLDRRGEGATSDGIRCIDYAIENGADVINASWASPARSSGLSTAISTARQLGIIFVAAAGNEAKNNDSVASYPSSYRQDNVVAVAATTRTDALAEYSNYGASSVDVAAPGSAIYSTWHSSDRAYEFLSGTSMSAPFVSGIFALMKAHFPDATHQELIEKVLATVDVLPGLRGRSVSGGRANLNLALGPNLLARFSVSPPTGAPPLRVQFTDESLGDIVDWEWDFGDGSAPASGSEVTHTYSRAANFPIRLKITSEDGSTSETTQIISVVANYRVGPDFYDWIVPSDQTQIEFMSDGVSEALSIPFPFTFFGRNYREGFVSAHGLMGFERIGLERSANANLPSPSVPNALIGPYWDEMHPQRGGAVWFGITGHAPNRQVVVTWERVRLESEGTPVEMTFQAMLEETSHSITFQYQDTNPGVGFAGGRSATIGIENDTGTIANRYLFNGSRELGNEQSIAFHPLASNSMDVDPSDALLASGPQGGTFRLDHPAITVANIGKSSINWFARSRQEWISLSQSGGALESAQSHEIGIHINENASRLSPARYSGVVDVINLTSGIGSAQLKVSLVVDGDNPSLSVTPDSGLNASGPPGGPFFPASQVFTVVNSGDATLDWSANGFPAWTNVHPDHGRLAPGDSATVVAVVNAFANEFEPSRLQGFVEFRNLTNGVGTTRRDLQLTVGDVRAPVTLSGVINEGRISIVLVGEAGRLYRLESSIDLNVWTQVFEGFSDSEGRLMFNEDMLFDGTPRFYRGRIGE